MVVNKCRGNENDSFRNCCAVAIDPHIERPSTHTTYLHFVHRTKFEQNKLLCEEEEKYGNEEQRKKWECHVTEALKELRKSLHHKKVQEMRVKASTHNEKIEAARLDSKERGACYKHITKGSYSPPATELLVEGEWVDTPGGIKKIEETNLCQHTYGRTARFTVRAKGKIRSVNPLQKASH